MNHYLIKIVGGEIPRVARKQTEQKSVSRILNNKPRFPKSNIAELQSRWLVVASPRDFDKNERLRKGELVRESELLDYSRERVQGFYKHCEAKYA
jgi:hypothetical protein